MGKRISTLKRVGLVSLALAMGLLAMPVALGGKAYAEGECVGPTDSDELRNALRVPNPGTITLCGDITARDGFEISGKRVATIDLNGHSISKINNGGSVLSTSGRGSLTVVGDGMVNGGLSGNLDIQGGSYDRDPSHFVRSPRKAYQLTPRGRWIIDVVLDDFTATPATKAVRVGETYTITNNIEALGSASGVTYTSNDEAVATVDATGVVTGVAEGTTTVTVTPTYDPRNAVTVNVSVYNIVAEDETDEADEVVADSLKEVIDEGGLPKDPHNAPEEAKEVLGEGAEYRHAHEAIRTAMGNGDTITTAIEVDDEYEPTDHEVALVEERLADYDVVEIAYYDVSAIARDSEGEILAYLHKLNERVVVALATTSEPAEGYTRRYLVVHILDGVPYLLTEGEDFYIEDGVLYVITDRFSTFAVAYEDTLVPEPTITVKTTVKAPETGANTEAKGSASANAAVAVAGAIAATMVASAVVFAKRK